MLHLQYNNNKKKRKKKEKKKEKKKKIKKKMVATPKLAKPPDLISSGVTLSIVYSNLHVFTFKGHGFSILLCHDTQLG